MPDRMSNTDNKNLRKNPTPEFQPILGFDHRKSSWEEYGGIENEKRDIDDKPTPEDERLLGRTVSIRENFREWVPFKSASKTWKIENKIELKRVTAGLGLRIL